MASFLPPTVVITLLLLILSPSLSNAALILDEDGDVLRNGGQYYVVPHSTGNNGGLKVTRREFSSPCPLFITQDLSNSGNPVTISSPLFIGILKTSFPIEFYFERIFSTCLRTLRWWVTPSDANNKSYVIVGTSRPFKPTYTFHIEEAKDGKNVYKIKFCHTIESDVFKVTARECKDVTILDNGYLGVAEDAPFPVTFQKYYIPLISSYA